MNTKLNTFVMHNTKMQVMMHYFIKICKTVLPKVCYALYMKGPCSHRVGHSPLIVSPCAAACPCRRYACAHPPSCRRGPPWASCWRAWPGSRTGPDQKDPPRPSQTARAHFERRQCDPSHWTLCLVQTWYTENIKHYVYCNCLLIDIIIIISVKLDNIT